MVRRSVGLTIGWTAGQPRRTLGEEPGGRRVVLGGDVPGLLRIHSRQDRALIGAEAAFGRRWGGATYFGVAGTAWLASAQFIGVLCFVLPSGFLADRYGHRAVIFAGVVIFAGFTWLIGYSSDFQAAFVFRLVSGFGEGLFWPAVMSAVANYFGGSKGLTLGIFYAGFDLGGAAGNSIGSASYALTADWRTAFLVAPLIGIPVMAGVAGSRKSFAAASSRSKGIPLGRGR